MNNRTEIFAADLYVLLQREFRRRQSPDCGNCYLQLPFRVDRVDAHSANWEVLVPLESCPKGCREIIEDLVNEFAVLYDLRPEDGQRRG